VLSESYWLLEETAGIWIRPVGVLYMFTVSLLFVLLVRQVQVGGESSFGGVLGLYRSFLLVVQVVVWYFRVCNSDRVVCIAI